MNALAVISEYLYLGVQLVLAFFLLQPFILLLLYGMQKMVAAGKKTLPVSGKSRDYHFGVVITAHRETDFIPPIVDSLLKQSYPHFSVYIIADECDSSNLVFDDPRIHVLTPSVPLRSKTRAIEYAMDRFSSLEEILVIFDPDNLVHPQFLSVLNNRYNQGFRAVQGSLRPKNLSGKYEYMDNIGVLFNNFIDRDMRSTLGLSVNIWGCGVSVDRRIYQQISYDWKSRSGGFDKHMQIEMAKRVPRIAYAADAILYDEKVSSGRVLEKQRTRWILAWFKFLGEAFGLFWEGIRRANFNLVYFGFNLIKPPYFLQLLLALLFVRLNWVHHRSIADAWLLIVGIFALSFIMIITIGESTRSAYKGMRYMPLFFYHQVNALFRIRPGKRPFVKTEHSKIIYIDDLLKHAPNP